MSSQTVTGRTTGATSATTRRRTRWAARRASILLAWTVIAGLVSSEMQSPPAAAVSEAPFGDQVNLSNSPSLSHHPNVASAGNYVYVVWEEYGFPTHPTRTQITFRRSTHTNEWGDPAFENTQILAAKSGRTGGGVVGRPQVAAVDSSVFVTWTQVDLVPGGGTNVFLVRSNDGGATFSAPVNLSRSNTAGWLNRVAVSGSNVFVVFVDEGTGTCPSPYICGYDVFGVASSDGGASFSPPVNLSQSRALSGQMPNVAVAASAHTAYAIWSENTAVGSGIDIRLASFNSGGELEQTVNLSGTPTVESMQVTVAASGDNVYTAWAEPQGTGTATEPKDIYFRGSGDRGQAFGPVTNVTQNSGDSAFPQLAASGDKVFLTWMDGTDGRFDVWFTRSTTGGVAFAPLNNLTWLYNSRMGTWGVLPAIAAAGDRVHILWTSGEDILYLGSKVAGGDLIFTEPGVGLAPTVVYRGIPGEIAQAQRLSATGGSVYATWEAGAMTPRFVVEQPELSDREIFFRGVVGPNPDLELAAVEPVQAPYYANVLAARKKTKVRVVINNNLIDLEDVTIRLLWKDGTSTEQEVVEHHPLQIGTNVFYMPANGTISPEDSELRVTAMVDSDYRYYEYDETNNAREATLPVKYTRTFRVMYVPVQFDGESVSCLSLQDFATRTTAFLRATFPVGDEGFQDIVNCAPLSYDLIFGSRLDRSDRNRVLLDLDRLKWFSTVGAGSVDRVVGVVPPGWFRNRTVDATNAVGVALVGGHSAGVLVELREGNDDPSLAETSGATTAHEIGHTFGWVAADHPMAKPDSPRHFGILSAPGYWVSAGIPMGMSSDFMLWQTNFPGYDWVSADTFQFLLSKLKDDPADPPVVSISGVVHQDDHADLYPWYRFDGILDRELGQTGEYTIVYLDAQGQTLGTTGFDVSFDMPDADPSGSDTAPFSLRIPDVEGTARLVLRHGGQDLASRDVTPNPPQVHLTSPDGGEIAAPGQALTITWDSSDPDGGTLTHTVSLSHDGGATWVPIALDVVGHEFTFTPTAVDTTTQALVRVTVTDGINTAEDVSDAPFTIRKGVGSEATYGPTINVSDTAISDPAGRSSFKAVSVADGQNVYASWSDAGSLLYRRSTDGGASFGSLTDLGKTRDVGAAYGTRMAVAGGRVYVAWKGYVPPESYTQPHILFRRSTNGGSTFDPVQSLEPVGGKSSEDPQVAASGDHVYVLWFDGATNDLILRVSHDAGATFGAPVVVGNAAPQPSLSGMNAVSPRLVASGARVFIVWSSYVDGRTDVFFNRSTDGGGTFTGPVKLSSNPGGVQADIEPQLAMGDGRLYVAWREVVPTGDTSSINHLFLRRSTDDGASFSPALDVRPQWPASSPLEYGTLKSFNLAAAGADVFLAWMTGPLAVSGGGDPDDGQRLILLSASHDGGTTFAAPVRLAAAAETRLTDPPEVTTSGGNVYVAWSQLFPIDSSGYYRAEERLRRSTDGGASFDDAVSLATSGACDTYPSFATLPLIPAADGARVLWQGRNCARTSFVDKDLFLSAVHESVSTNQPPEVDTGADREVAAGDVVMLVATATDPDGDQLLGSWSQTGGPPVVAGTTGTSALTFLAPEVDAPITLTFQFTASDGLASSTDTVTVTVTRRAPITNFQAQYPEVWSLYIAPALDEGPPVLPEQLDTTPPAVTCTVTPAVLWPPNHRLVGVTVSVNVDDGDSGPDGFALVAVASNEPDNGLGDGDTAHDIQGWSVGTDDIAGELRAERSATGSGRVYTLTYEGRDVAGNTAACVATVTVPHDRRP